MLAEVDGEVGDPAGVRLVAGQRAGPQGPADPAHDVGGDGFDQGSQAQGPPHSATQVIFGVSVNFGRGCA